MLRIDPEREEAELRAYLGAAYDLKRLQHSGHTLEEEAAAVGDEHTFYRTSHSYLYNLTAFAMTGTKLPYLNLLTRHIPRGSRVLDYGCGIGSDGLLLLEAGYRVEFADFDNPSTEYLRWRLRHRSLDAPIHDLDRHVPDGFDAAYAFDVIEHAPDAFAFLREMEARARLVEVNLLEFEPHHQTLHYHLPINEIVQHAAARKLKAYRVFYGTSHLLLYGTEPVGPLRRRINQLRITSARSAIRGRAARLKQRVRGA
jgi:SAM-dependent methyltransferase